MSQAPLATALVVPFEQLRMTDVEVVGGKNASLGEMISQLAASARFAKASARAARASLRGFEKMRGTRTSFILFALPCLPLRRKRCSAL